MMKTNLELPAHIRQLVDKKNYVIAIKTYAQEQNIGLEQAKEAIDAYEESQKNKPIAQSFDNLQASIDNHLQQQNIKRPIIPYWAKRIIILLIVVGIFGVLLYRLLG